MKHDPYAVKFLMDLRRVVRKWAGRDFTPREIHAAFETYEQQRLTRKVTAMIKNQPQEFLSRCVKQLRGFGPEWPTIDSPPEPTLTHSSAQKTSPQQTYPGKTPPSKTQSRMMELYPDVGGEDSQD